MRLFSVLLASVAQMRKPMLWAGILAGLAVGGVIFLCVMVMLDGKRDAEHQADQAAANMAETIQEEIARTFELFDLSLQGVVDAMNDPEIVRLTGRARQIALFDNASKATYLNAIIVLDETGKIVDDSRSLVPPDRNLADREYFRVHEDNPDVGMYLSHPFKSRFQEGEWTSPSAGAFPNRTVLLAVWSSEPWTSIIFNPCLQIWLWVLEAWSISFEVMARLSRASPFD